MLSKALAAEMAHQGIRVNTIAPAFTETEMTKVARDHNAAAADIVSSPQPGIGRAVSALGRQMLVTASRATCLSDQSPFRAD